MRVPRGAGCRRTGGGVLHHVGGPRRQGKRMFRAGESTATASTYLPTCGEQGQYLLFVGVHCGGLFLLLVGVVGED